MTNQLKISDVKEDAQDAMNIHEVGNVREEDEEEEEGYEEEGEEVTFEPFEPGNIWTQKISTQVYRSAWRRQMYLESESSEPDPSKEITAKPASTAAVVVVDDDDDDDEADEVQEVTNEIPWWSKGKTAPLLADFDIDRRRFYLAQAGIGEYNAASSRGQHTHEGRLAQQVSPVRRSLSLAGNTNSPNAGPTTTTTTNIASIISTTPRKKTWDATWGKDGERNVNTSNKKQATTSDNTVRGTPIRARGASTPNRARGASTPSRAARGRGNTPQRGRGAAKAKQGGP